MLLFFSGKSMMFIAMLLYWSVDLWQVHWRSHVRPALVFITFRAVQMIEKPPFGWICLILNGQYVILLEVAGVHWYSDTSDATEITRHFYLFEALMFMATAACFTLEFAPLNSSLIKAGAKIDIL